jgi:hypothetical protein
MIKLTQLINELGINNPNKIPLYFINDDYVYVLLDNKYKYKRNLKRKFILYIINIFI